MVFLAVLALCITAAYVVVSDEDTGTVVADGPTVTIDDISFRGSVNAGVFTVTMGGNYPAGTSTTFTISGPMNFAAKTLNTGPGSDVNIAETTILTGGTYTIKATALGSTDSKTYTVLGSINLSDMALNVNETKPTGILLDPVNPTNNGVNWASSDTNIATVDNNGNVKGISAGSATITATSKENSSISGSCNVVVSSTPGPVSYTITPTVDGSGGRISPNTPQEVNEGTSITFTVTANSGYRVDRVLVDGNIESLTNGRYTFDNIDADHEIQVSFTVIPDPEPGPTRSYSITASAGTGGTISPSGTVSVSEGSSRIFTVTANSGYDVDRVLVDGVGVTLTDGKYTISNVRAAHTISASFKVAETFIINVEVTTNGGSLTPSGRITINSGGSQEFLVTPDEGYELEKVLVNGESVDIVDNKFTVSDVRGNTIIEVSFKESGSSNNIWIWVMVAIVVIVIIAIVAIVVMRKSSP